MSEPAWGDPTWGGKAIIQPGWSSAGTTGWYAGHLGPGQSARFDNLRTWQYTYATTTPSTTSTAPSTTSTAPPDTTTGGDDGGAVVITGPPG